MSEAGKQISEKKEFNLLRRLSYWLVIFIITVVNVTLLYYILINTVFRDTVLPNIVINGHQVGFADKSSVERVLGTKNFAEADVLTVKLEELTFQVPLDELKIRFSADEALNFGKGANPIKVIQEGTKAISGVQIDQDFEFNSLAILEFSPIDFQSNFASSYIGDTVECRKNRYNFEIDFNYLETMAREAIVSSEPVVLSYNNLFKDSKSKKLINDCNRYFSEIKVLEIQTSGFLDDTGASLELLYDLKVDNSGETRWAVSNIHELRERLEQYSRNNATLPEVKDWKFKDNDIYLLSPYTKGKKLNVDKSYANFLSWQGEDLSPLVYDDVEKPEFKGRVVYDFSKVIAQGKTRLSLKVDGVRNPSISNAEGGLMLIDGAKVLPKERFSYIDTVKMSQRTFVNEYSIGYGTCNSTTTIFRAALEGGFPIDERHSHGFVVESYAWGYPYNFVDASYFPDPRVDFKFTNDLDYPIYLNVVISNDDTYRYHTVEIRTSQSVSPREVTIGGWKYIDNYSPKSFTGQFTRSVKDKDGKLVRTDKFVSRYR